MLNYKCYKACTFIKKYEKWFSLGLALVIFALFFVPLKPNFAKITIVCGDKLIDFSDSFFGYAVKLLFIRASADFFSEGYIYVAIISFMIYIPLIGFAIANIFIKKNKTIINAVLLVLEFLAILIIPFNINIIPFLLPDHKWISPNGPAFYLLIITFIVHLTIFLACIWYGKHPVEPPAQRPAKPKKPSDKERLEQLEKELQELRERVE